MACHKKDAKNCATPAKTAATTTEAQPEKAAKSPKAKKH